MKSTFARAIVLTLTVAGLAASAKTAAPAKTVTSSFSGYPMPMCDPGSGNYCGMH
jgi:hypothetical protein